MGPNNMSLWKELGIKVQLNDDGSYNIVNKIKHPVDPVRFIYFYADVPHLEKNLAGGWRKCGKITISENICKENNFPAKAVINIEQVTFKVTKYFHKLKT
jgi:hypothetical protein